MGTKQLGPKEVVKVDIGDAKPKTEGINSYFCNSNVLGRFSVHS